MKIKVIFYDFDGVIKDSTNIKSKAFYDLYAPFGDEIAKKVAKYHLENGGISRFEKIKYFHQEFLKINLSEQEIAEWADKFSALVLQNVIESNYVFGALESIKTLANQYQQFIITGTPQNEIEFICEKSNISTYFVEICGSPKNKISWCNELIKKHQLSSNEIVFIGDATTDFEAAEACKLHFILREHEENEKLFSTKDIIKVKDLNNLAEVIKNNLS